MKTINSLRNATILNFFEKKEEVLKMRGKSSSSEAHNL